VVERVHSLIERLEAEHQDTAIAFFSHADTVQILQVQNQKKSIWQWIHLPPNLGEKNL